MSYSLAKFITGIFLYLVLSNLNQAVAQRSEIYEEEYSTFRIAQDLFDKEMYSAAQEKFRLVVNEIDNKQDEIRINSEYYVALCALELFHKDTEHLLNRFAFDHPDHPKGKKINFQLGRYYYRSKTYSKAIEYFEKVDQYDLSDEELIEYQFKLGYSYFYKKEQQKAKVLFHEVVKTENEYYVPAQYYYSHISYEEGNYQTALEGFKKIEDNEMFAAVVPYYITQIYYHQERYKDLITYAPPHYETVSSKRRGEFAKLIGDSYYYEQNFKDAIPYLLDYRKSSKVNREDYYQLGYAYYRTGDFKNATVFLGKSATKKDELSQSSYYHMGDCYLKLEEKDKAQNAFKAASHLDFDEEVQKNSLYNYAKLAFELAYNPYDEAIDAFQRYIEMYPNDPNVDEAYEFLLKVYMTTKNYKEALVSLEKIKKLDDRMKMAYQSISYNLAVEQYHNRNYTEAISSFKKAQKYRVNKEYASESYYWIAEANYNLGKYNSAVANYVDFKLEPGAALSKEFYNADYGIAYAYFMQSSPFELIDDWDNQAIRDAHNDLLQKSVTSFRSFIVLKDRLERVKLQDAYLRLADCYYLLREDKKAIEYYNIAISNGTNDMSYAYFQKARSQGALDDNQGKANTLETLTTKYPNSSYVSGSLMELADAYRVLNENTKAITTYKTFISRYPNNLNVAKAKSNIAFIYLRLKDYNNAEKYALQVLNEFPNDRVEVEKSIETIRGVYEGRNDLPGYYTWLESQGIDVKPSEMDSSLWEPVQYAFDNGDCATLIGKGQVYLSQLPNGSKATDANFYLAQCKYASKPNQALEHYNFVINKGMTEYYEEALQYGAFLAFDKEDYPLAISHYSKLEQVATKEENHRNSVIAQMHSHKKLDNAEKIIEYADKVISLSGIDGDLATEALLNKGLAQKKLKMFNVAKQTLLECHESTVSIMGAEAKYNYCEILHGEDDYENCEKGVMELVKQKPSYDYWIAKSIILLGRNYMALGDYFNAKHSLQSVVDHYDGKDKAEIVNTAQNLIDEIIALENGEQKSKSLDEEEDIQFDNLDEKDKKLFDESENDNN